MVTSSLKATVEDDFELTGEQVAELERRDTEIRTGAVTPLTVDQLMQRVRPHIR